MPEQHNFENLPLLLRYRGRARLRGSGEPSPQTRANRNACEAHSVSLRTSAQSLIYSVYRAEIIHLLDGEAFDSAVLPDSFTARLKISGKGLKDIILNYPYIFEVVEPEDIALPQRPAGAQPGILPHVAPVAPVPNAPAVCIIDSGIQEGHILLAPAIDQGASHCFLPGRTARCQ